MDVLALGAALSIMGAIVVGIIAMQQASAGPRTNVNRRLGSILSGQPAFEAIGARYEGLRQRRLGRVPIISSLLEGKDWTTETALRLERADMKLTVSEFVGLRIFLAFVGMLIPFLVLGSGPVAFLVIAFGALIGYLLPSLYVGRAAGKRAAKLGAQLPEALTLISNSIKAGFGLMQALDLASREMEHPLSTEIRRTLHDINVGSATDTALENMAKRCGSDDLDIVITAMLIQQSSGGNLSEILDNVAHTMRERIRIRGEIKTLTTQQTFTGWIIGALPFAMLALFSVVNPSYETPMFRETLGQLMLVGACVLEFFGVLLIRRVLAIEV
jgi:tight adherence protein B